MADAVTLPRFRAADLVVRAKPDLTPVSDADKAAEEALRRCLAESRPDDAILGEEFGDTHATGSVPGRSAGSVPERSAGPVPERSAGSVPERSDSARRWVLDPIDGTKNYVRGIPVWASLIALERDGVPAVGVVSAPALGRRWWAARGSGAFADGNPIRVSAVSDLGDAHLSYDSLVDFERYGLGEAALALERRCWRTRGFGDFWSHVLVAEGAVDVAVEPVVEHWDVSPLWVIVEEAGGSFSDVTGARRATGRSALSTNGILHQEVLRILGPAPTAR